MSFNTRQLRDQLRLIHILASVSLGIVIYSPWHSHPLVLMTLSFVIFPILSLTGLWMWQAPRIKKGLTQVHISKGGEV